jgi:hypothetical protein
VLSSALLVRGAELIYIECPDEVPSCTCPVSLFLAGSITGAWDWQAHISAKLVKIMPEDAYVLNPRRREFNVSDPSASEMQIVWEFNALEGATAILFWFAKGTLSPITMYELGRATLTKKTIFVGVEPGFYREFDIQLQLSLARPGVHIVHSLESLVCEVEAWLEKTGSRSSA